MARIGDYIQAGLNNYDPSPYLQASGDATRSIGNSIAQGVGAVGSAIDRRSEYKQDVKMGKELAKAMKTLYPDIAPTIDPYLAELENDENPLSHQAALGKGVGTVISQYIGERDNLFDRSMAERGMSISERGMAIDESRNTIEVDSINRAMREREQATMDAEQSAAFVAPELLKQVLEQTAAMEQSGMPVGIPAARLQEALNAANPQQQMSIAEAAMSMMPKAAPLEFRDIEFTRGGQPAKGTAVFDPARGQFNLVPVADPSAQPAENPGLVEMVKDFESFIPNAYDDYKQTSIGYGTRAKPGEKTISKEEAERRLLDELASARKGVDRAVAAAGLSLNPNQLDALTSFNYNTGAVNTLLKGGARSPEEIAQAMLLYNKAGGKTLPGLQKRRAVEAQLFATPAADIAPGAARTLAAQTPTQAKLDELRLAKEEGEAKIAETAGAGNLAKSQAAIESLKAIRNHPGRAAATGFTSVFPTRPGSQAYDFEQKLEQAKALAGTIGIEAMRGLGAMSEKEFQAAKDSIAALDKGQKTETIEKELDKLIGLFEAKIGQATAATATGAAPAPRTSAAARLRALQGK